MPSVTEVASPLTERILARLPGSRVSWVAVWVLLTIARPFAVTSVELGSAGWDAVLRETRPFVAATLVFGYMVAVSLFAIARLARDAHTVEPSISRLLPPDAGVQESSMSAVGSVAGPLLLTVAATAFSFYEELLLHGTSAALIGTPLALIVNLPVMTLLWVLVAILRGFARIGRRELLLDSQFGDPSLGLARVGLLAFNGFVAFLAVLVPYLLASVPRPRDLAVGVIVATVPIILELVSLYRLHLQMVAARVRYVTWTRQLYALVVDPVRGRPEPSVLEARAALVTAAVQLVRRSEATQEWPVTDRSFGIMLGVAAGVVTSVFARVVLGGLGL